MILDSDDFVLSFQYEQVKVPYFIYRAQKLIKRNTYPDFLVNFNDGTSLIYEIKGEFQFIKDTTQAKLDATKEYCKNNDLSFQLITIRELFELSKGMEILTKEEIRSLNRRNNRFLRNAN